ncbi:MAG: DUF4214 domain-containing protein, partial [Gemmiger sp.]|nr:DUF4214 domain-containing protein [Gemmiger sp.]
TATATTETALFEEELDTLAANDVTAFVTRLYKVALNRNPDGPGLADWVSRLTTHVATGCDVVRGFMLSPEYLSKNKSRDQIITDAYNAMLGRAPDASGFEHWQIAFSLQMTTEGIISGFCGSQEFIRLCNSYGVIPGTLQSPYYRDANFERTYFVYRLYANCLGRPPEVSGLENWCAALASGKSGIEVANGFFNSTEYQAHAYDNSSFILTLYRTLLGREPDYRGSIEWVTKLNAGASRASILNGFFGSQEFMLQCRTAGIVLGNFLSVPDNTTSWKLNAAILTYANYKRSAAGLNKLASYDNIYNAALTRAKEITSNNSHTRPNNTDWTTVLRDNNIPATILPSSYWADENIAAIPLSNTLNISKSVTAVAEAAVDAWLSNDATKAKLLNGNYNTMGAAFYEVQKAGKGYYYIAQCLMALSNNR